jgi:hypothetical protein
MALKLLGEFCEEPSSPLKTDGSIDLNSLRFELRATWDMTTGMPGEHITEIKRKYLVMELTEMDQLSDRLGNLMDCKFVLKQKKDGTVLAHGKLRSVYEADQNGWWKWTGSTTDHQNNVSFMYVIPECDCDDGEFIIDIS